MNSCKYSGWKLLLVFPFIVLSFSFAALQLLFARCVCTLAAGSTKLTEWFRVSRFKARSEFCYVLSDISMDVSTDILGNTSVKNR